MEQSAEQNGAVAPFDATTLEERLMYCICRNPSLVTYLSPEFARAIANDTVRKVIGMALHLHYERSIEPTVGALASAGAAPIDDLQYWSDMATSSIQQDFTRDVQVVQRAAQLRKAIELTGQVHQWLLKNGKPTNIEDAVQRLEQRLAELRLPTSASNVALGTIIEEALEATTESPPIPTGYQWIDSLMNGGLRAGQIAAIIGPPKSGKTMIMRNMLWNMAQAGYHVVHIAHDGGQADYHAMSYWAIATRKIVVEDKGSSLLNLPDGKRLDIVSPDWISQAYRYRKIVTQDHGELAIPDSIWEYLDAGLQVMRQYTRKGGAPGRVHIYDARKITGNLLRLLDFLRGELVGGMHLFAVDHLGLFGSRDGMSMTEKVQATVPALATFVQNHGVRSIWINQVGVASASSSVAESKTSGGFGGIITEAHADYVFRAERENKEIPYFDLHVMASRHSRHVEAQKYEIHGPSKEVTEDS